MGISNALDHPSGPADSLTDHALHCCCGQSRRKHFCCRVSDIPCLLHPKTGFEIFRHRIIWKSADLLQRSTQNHCIASGVSGSIGGISHNIDLPGKEVLFVWDIFFRKQMKLEQILIVKALRSLNKPDFSVRNEKIWYGSNQKFSPWDHVRVKCGNQRRACMRKSVIIISRLCMSVFRQPQVSDSETFGKTANCLSVTVITDIDMNFFRIRIFHEGTGIHCLIEKISRLIVRCDKHIHIRKHFLRNIRERNHIIAAFHFSDHKFSHSQRSHCFRQYKKYSGCGLKYAGLPWYRGRNSPHKINSVGGDRQNKPPVSFFLIIHLPRHPPFCAETPIFSASYKR